MESHIKILGILHVIMGSLGLLAAVIVLVVFGGIAGVVTTADNSTGVGVTVPILGAIGGFAAIVILIFSLPGLIGGIGLLMKASWSRVYMIVISALHLLHIPLGTALGIYGLWILTKPETEALLSHRQVVSYPR
jgi:hypothetical protein